MDNPSIDQMLQAALNLQQSGQIPDAEKAFRQVLMRDPKQPHALNGLGTIILGMNRPGDAADFFGRAVAANPSELGFQMNLGTALLKSGRLREAGETYQRVINLKPDFAEAYTNIGVVLAELGRLDDAVTAHRRCIELKPQYSGAFVNLGAVYQLQGKYGQSVEVLKQALAIEPNRVETIGKLAASYIGMGPTDRLKYLDAIEVLKQGLELQPSHPYLLTYLGVAMARMGKVNEAAALHRRALEIFPGLNSAVLNLAVALHHKGEIDEAIACYRRGMAAEPNEPGWHYNLAFSLLVQGKWEEGLAEFEWRLRDPRQYNRPLPRPLWDGSNPAGKTILLLADQGVGDTLHFVRYASLLAQSGATVLVEAQKDAVSLVKRAPGVSDAVAQGDALPAHDFYIPLPSLPHAFHTTPQSIPAPIPYLSASPELAAQWKDRLAQHGPGFKVGLVWAGNPVNRIDIFRSMLLAELAPLAGIAGVKYFSLQKGPQASQVLSQPSGLDLVDLGRNPAGFEEMAAIIANLDLLISVDTAAAHLAAAMGKPVWNILAYVPDWRWLLSGSTTPWYPTMRLFRQPALGDWATAVGQVRSELAALVEKPRE